MGKSLVIVESPAKAKTINKILGNDFIVKASVGHIVDLPNNTLGVDVDNDFTPEYITIKGKGKILKEIKLAARGADKVYMASDPDREGEAISWHIAQKIGVNEDKIFRLLFNEITKSGIMSALSSPCKIDEDKVNAQQARRILDRLVGYKISPLLWKKVKRGLSAGRVQSVAMRLICEREDEVLAFNSEEFWSVEALLTGKSDKQFKAKLHFISGKSFKLKNEKETTEVVERLKDVPYTVADIKERMVSRKPAPPFITSTLQQEGARKLYFTSKKTMRVAQFLYEGMDIGKGEIVGLITYMRTDSTRVSKDSQEEASKYITEKFGKKYTPAKPPVYKSKKSSQDAHEAVRPTSVYRTPESVKSFLDKDQFRLYTLIWQRFVASQMSNAKISQTTVNIEADNCIFRTSGSVVKFTGFMGLYMEGKDDVESSKSDEQKLLPPIEKGELLRLEKLDKKQHFTQPPPRYTESTLIKILEEKAIGRPSTYASIINTIIVRKYIVKENKQLVPTELGTLINGLLVSSFPDILNVKFTAKMENELDLIEEGKLKWIDSLKEFYVSFSSVLEDAEKNMKNIKEPKETNIDCPKCDDGKLFIKWGKNGHFLACSNYPKCCATMDFTTDKDGKINITKEEVVEEKCDMCGQNMVVKKGRFGKFLACSNYPDCRHTSPMSEDKEGDEDIINKIKEEKCEKCGSEMVLKRGRFGKFAACSSYPKCKNAKPISIGIFCPEEGCSGYLSERLGKRGKPFYGCSNYPKCRYVIWSKPVKTECPKCGAKFLIEDLKNTSLKRCSNAIIS